MTVLIHAADAAISAPRYSRAVQQVARLARRLDIRWLDVMLAAVLTVWAVLEGGGRDSATFSPAVLLTTVPLLARRRWPVPVLVVALIGFGLAGTSSGLASLLGGLTAAVSVGLYARHQNAAAIVVIGSALFLALEFGQGSNTTLPVPGYLLPFLLLGAAYLAGRELGSRRNALEAQRERSAQIEREHETAIKAAAAAERQHIARELHDVVAHSVSVMVVQAGAARQVMADKPDAARESLLNVESVGHEAMAELRRLLGVLGTNGNEAPLAPQPGMSGLDALLERMRDAGLPVEVKVSGEPAVLPPGVDMAAFRIIQEALTNALKYAGGAPTRVGVSYAGDAVDIEVVDDGVLTTPADGIGRGLAGMRERVALFGGRVDAGTRPGGGYAVRAHLPLDPAS
jgi:signal transduction histidine kinase